MRIIIIEDETPAQRRLQKMMLELRPQSILVGTADSIEAAVALLQPQPAADLIFMDIELADGQSFEIFKQVNISIPVVFTTAYDAFALKAFEVNSIDYLLKPIRSEDLERSLKKWEQLRGTPQSSNAIDIAAIVKAIRPAETPQYKSRFLVHIGDKFLSLAIEQIAYFTTDEKLVMAYTNENKKYPIDYSLDDLEGLLPPSTFFRANRQFICNIQSIKNIHNYFNGKLKLGLQPNPDKEVLVSREKAGQFKAWLDQ
jgi:two-component system response regulator LytT